MWYQIGQGSPTRGEGKFRIKNHEEGNGKTPRFISPEVTWMVLLD